MTFKEWRNKYRSSYPNDLAQDAWEAATKVERERCAKIVEGMMETYHDILIVEAIRKGEK